MILDPSIRKNDRLAKLIIIVLSIIVFSVITLLSRYQLKTSYTFDVHIFATINASINSVVALLLIAALASVRMQRYRLHRNIMLTAMVLSMLFLISYIAHHLFAGETKFGDIDQNGIISDMEKDEVGSTRYFYYFLLLTHIPLAGIILPLILFTAYRGLTGEYNRHKKLARITWPLWLYVAISGVLVYIFINPYY